MKSARSIALGPQTVRSPRSSPFQLDPCLQSLSDVYALKRKEGVLGAIRVLQMPAGVFLKLRDDVAARGQAHWCQLKRLHVLRRAEDVAFLMSHALPPVE